MCLNGTQGVAAVERQQDLQIGLSTAVAVGDASAVATSAKE
jgi:hypothetical protein